MLNNTVNHFWKSKVLNKNKKQRKEIITQEPKNI